MGKQREAKTVNEEDIIAIEAGTYRASDSAKNAKKKSRIRMLGKQSKKY
jgi:hypothetical protein